MLKLTKEEKALEYLKYLECEGNFVLEHDKIHHFSNGVLFNNYFSLRKNFLLEFVNLEENRQLYPCARRKIYEEVCPQKLIENDISFIISKIVYDNYYPRIGDYETTFLDGTFVKNFCVIHCDDILNTIKNKNIYDGKRREKIINVMESFKKSLMENKKEMTYFEKMSDFIEELNKKEKNPMADKDMIFDDYSLMVDFWNQDKERIARELLENKKYENYEVANSRCKSITPATLFYNQKLDEYIRYYLNRGYNPVGFDDKYCFSSRERIGAFFCNRREIELALFNTTGPYSDVLYNKARNVLYDLKIRQAKEYIELLNTGYVPSPSESSIYFHNHELILDFWLRYRETIYSVYYSSLKYLHGYEVAGDVLSSFMRYDEKKKYYMMRVQLVDTPNKVKLVLHR